MTAQDDHFELMTALVYRASDSNEPYSLLARHFARLRTAHAAFAQERPESWCARVRMPDEAQILEALQGAVHDAQAEGKQGDLRVSLSGLPSGGSRLTRSIHSCDFASNRTVVLQPRRSLSPPCLLVSASVRAAPPFRTDSGEVLYQIRSDWSWTTGLPGMTSRTCGTKRHAGKSMTSLGYDSVSSGDVHPIPFRTRS